ncbi:hypothetical protein MKW94_023808 [Papaver nudicaule]|uniref:Holocarboxylase synthetase n=1 Tax=Papaver nudicaule TaxID=74823 RepID=A0AA42AZH7_PAPNU|nr:hypothetical protein [Papaver nudicaule]
MGKKRKSVASRLDEVDRTMYSTFCNAANSLSQLYTQAMNQQKLSFQAGERNAMEKLYDWIRRQQQEGSRVVTSDILAYLQNELDYGGEEPPMSPNLPFPQQHPHLTFMNSSIPVSSGSLSSATVGQVPRSGQFDNQVKNASFANALSSPIRRSLQNCQLAQGGDNVNNVIPSRNGVRNEAHSNDTFMDMRSDSPTSSP